MPASESSLTFDPSLADRLPTPPRRVRLRAEVSRFGRWFPRIFVLPHLIIAVGAAGVIVFTVLSLAFPEPVTGHVTSVRSGTSSKGRPTHTLCYAYPTPNGSHEECESVDAELLARFTGPDGKANGAELSLWRFGLLGVETARRTRGPSIANAVIFAWCLIWDTVMAFAFYALWIVPLRERNLCANGAVARGAVVRKRVVRGKGIRHYVTFRFTTAEGFSCEREVSAARADAWEACEEGTPITVLFDPDRPKRSIAYEFSHYELERDA